MAKKKMFRRLGFPSIQYDLTVQKSKKLTEREIKC